jgi:GT2 family glycosyltransferase
VHGKARVAVIIINYNHHEITCSCIDSILSSEYDDFDLHVVDNGSVGSDYEILKQKYQERIVLHKIEKNTGYVGGVNYGLQKCVAKDYSYYLIMNNDTIIDSRAIRYLVQSSKRYHDKCIVSGKVYHYDNPQYLQYIGQKCGDLDRLDFPPIVTNRMEKDLGQYDSEMEMGMLDDIFWLLPHGVFKKVGLYSEYFFLYGEQNDYAIRAVKQGYKLIYTPDAKIWHRGSMTTSKGDSNSPKLTFWRTKASLVLLTLHSQKRYLFNYFFKTFFKKVIIGLPVGIIRRIKGEKKALKNNLAILFALLYFISWYMYKRKDKGFNPFN